MCKLGSARESNRGYLAYESSALPKRHDELSKDYAYCFVFILHPFSIAVARIINNQQTGFHGNSEILAAVECSLFL